MTDTIEYRDETHQYFVNGVEFPSVSTVLSIMADFSRVPRETLQFKRQVGKAVHKAIELGDELDPDSVDESIAGYLQSWRKFLETRPLVVIASERIVYSLKYRYAGRLDLVTMFLDDPDCWLLDLKCT